MPIQNVIASVAVRDLTAAAIWYQQLFGRPPSMPTPDVAEWHFERGGWLQIYRLRARAGAGSFTLAVSDLQEQIEKLEALGIDTRERTSSEQLKTVMIVDPDGNHIALAEAIGPALAPSHEFSSSSMP